MEWIIGLGLGIGVIGFCLIFRKEISERIKNIKNIGKGGVNFGSKQGEEPNPESTGKTVDELTRTLDSQLLQQTEDSINQELKGWKLKEADTVKVLVKHYAALRIAFTFEQIYRLIFGSQLNALDFLNTQTVAQPKQVAQIFYSLATTQYADYYKNYDFNSWLAFMTDWLLVREDIGLLQITLMGREFLTHLTKTGLSRNKAG